MFKVLKYISSGGLFLAFLVCALFVSVEGIINPKETPQSATYETAISGKWASAYEKTFNENLSTYETSKSLWSYIVYKLYEVGKSGVIVGSDGWLFTSEEVALNPNHEKNIEENINYVLDVAHILKQKNVELVVAVIPAKARIYEQYLGRYSFPRYNEDVYYSFISALRDQNIVTTNLHWILDKKKNDFQIFLKTDTHWTQIGAKMAARTIYSIYEKELKEKVVFESGGFITRAKDNIDHKGDLLEFIPVGNLLKSTNLEIESLRELESVPILENEPEELDLFGDNNPLITLVGTSYSANPLWGFEHYLKEVFETDILNAADEGAGPFKTMEKYLENDAFKSSPPKLLIWEIPERYVSVKYDLKKPD